jgi:hypothetical protein
VFPFVTYEPSIDHCTIAETGGFMSKAIRTVVSLVVSLVLFSAMTMAQAGVNNTEKDKNKEHHSRLAKVAFWRNHKDADKNAKQATATPSKQAQAKTAPTKKDQKQEHASNVSRPSTKKAPAANKAKPQQSQDPKTASLK